MLLEDNDPAKALLKYISDSEVECLVLGSCSSSFLTRYLFVSIFERFAQSGILIMIIIVSVCIFFFEFLYRDL